MEQVKQNLLIAPCGMNCGICMAYLREKNHCCGCRAADDGKSVSILRCIIRKCEKLVDGFCFDCISYICKRMKQLDKRYRTKYNMSMLENLENIRNFGINKFVENENSRWACVNCGGKINVHKKVCSKCGK